jgi:hypothetical protein
MITSIQDLTTLADELRTLHASFLHVKAALEAGMTDHDCKLLKCPTIGHHVQMDVMREAIHTINNALQDVNATAELESYQRAQPIRKEEDLCEKHWHLPRCSCRP